MDATDIITLALLALVAAAASARVIRESLRRRREVKLSEGWRREMIRRRWKEF
ncbi:MAG: hypothetical protein AB1631_34535 [Acidobacteriota bacterium]